MSRIIGTWHGARAKGSQAGISYQEMVADKVKHKPGPPSKPGISAACQKGHHSQCFKKLCQCKVCKHPQVGQYHGCIACKKCGHGCPICHPDEHKNCKPLLDAVAQPLGSSHGKATGVVYNAEYQ